MADDIDKLFAAIESDSPTLIEESNSDERSGIGSALRDTGTSFKESFTDDKIGATKELLEKAIPRTISEEYNTVKDAVDEVKAIYDDNIVGLKKSAKGIVDLVKEKTPTNSKFRSILNRVSAAMATSERTSSFNSNQPTEDEVVAKKLDDLFTKNRKMDQVKDIIQETKEEDRHGSTIKLLADILGNLRYSNRFREDVAERYYRKSLELKYKHLYLSKQQLEATKIGFDTFKTQLDAIVHNTNLPDLVKLRRNEQLRETLQHRFRENLADVFYSTANPLTQFKENLVKKIASTTTGIKDGLMGAGDMASMAGATENIPKAQLAGMMLADKAKSYFGDLAGEKLNSNRKVREKLYDVKTAMADPKEYLRELAGKEFDKNTRVGRLNSKILRMIGDITNSDRDNLTRYKEFDLDEATMFDNRTKNSIVKIIPNLLSKMYIELRGIRTGEDSSGLFYDYNTSTIRSRNNIKDNMLKDASRALHNSAGGNLDRISRLVKDDTLTDEDLSDFRKSILTHVTENRSMSPKALLSDEFINTLPESKRDRIREAIAKTLEDSKDDLYILDDIKSSMMGVKNNTPLIDKQIEDYYRNGQMDEVIKTGLVDYDETNKLYTINRAKYIELLHDAHDLAKNGKVAEPEISTPNINTDAIKIAREAIKRTKSTSGMESSLPIGQSNYQVDKNNLYMPTGMDMAKFTIPTQLPKTIEEETRTNVIREAVSSTIGRNKAAVDKIIENQIKEAYKPNFVMVDEEDSFSKEKESIKKNIFDNFKVDTTLDNLIKESKVGYGRMFNMYKNTGAHLSGMDFKTWTSNIGFKSNGDEFVKSEDIDDESKFTGKEATLKSRFRDKLLNGRGLDVFRDKNGKITIGSILKKTREWDRKMFKSIPSVIGGTIGAGIRTPKAILELIKGKKQFGDNDGDGDIDNGWKDRLSRFKDTVTGKKKTKEDKDEDGTDKKSGGIWDKIKSMIPLLGTLMAGLGSVGGMFKSLASLGMSAGKAIVSAGSLAVKAVKGGAAVASATATGISAAKATGSVAAGVAAAKGKLNTKKPSGNKIMNLLKGFKSKIAQKFGKSAGGKILAKLASKISARLIPGLGQAILAYDAVMITKLMIGGLALNSAISKQILGFDLFNDDDPAVDEQGEPIKPDEPDTEKEIERAEKNNTIDKVNMSDKKAPIPTNEKPLSFLDRIKKALGIDSYRKGTGDRATVLKDGTNDYLRGGTFTTPPSKEEVFSSIEKAAKLVGVDPNVLKIFAGIESDFNPRAKAPTSSAKGLFQFIDGTWSSMVEKYGDKYGVDRFTSPYDPLASSIMGALYIKDNAKYLSAVKDNISPTDLYMAHFLGPKGAKDFFSARTDDIAAGILPKAARANRSIFFKRDRTPRTIAEVYELMQNKIMGKAQRYGFIPKDTSKTVASKEPANNTRYDSKSPISSKTPAPILNGNVGVKDKPKKSEVISKIQKKESKEPVLEMPTTVDLTPNLNSIEGVLNKSYDVQVNMSKTLDKILDKLDDKTLAKETTSSSKSKMVMDIPEPPINVAKKRYNAS